MEQDRADRLSDRVEERTLAQCQVLYSEALTKAVRRAAAGAQAAVLIRSSMDEIERINRVVDDIGEA